MRFNVCLYLRKHPVFYTTTGIRPYKSCLCSSFFTFLLSTFDLHILLIISFVRSTSLLPSFIISFLSISILRLIFSTRTHRNHSCARDSKNWVNPDQTKKKKQKEPKQKWGKVKMIRGLDGGFLFYCYRLLLLFEFALFFACDAFYLYVFRLRCLFSD